MILRNRLNERIEIFGMGIDARKERKIDDAILNRHKAELVRAVDAGAIEVKYPNGNAVPTIDDAVDAISGIPIVNVSTQGATEEQDNGMFYILIDRFYAEEDEWDIRPIAGTIYKMHIRASQKTIIRFMKDGELIVEQIIHRLLPIDVNPTLGYEIDEIQFKGLEKRSSIRVEIEAYTRNAIANSAVGQFVKEWSE